LRVCTSQQKCIWDADRSMSWQTELPDTRYLACLCNSHWRHQEFFPWSGGRSLAYGLRLNDDQSGCTVSGTKCFRPLEYWDLGFESHSRDGYLRLFSVFVLSCIGIGLAMGLSAVQGALPTFYKIHNFRINFEFEQARGAKPSRYIYRPPRSSGSQPVWNKHPLPLIITKHSH
jgi:hypothetical protein